MPRKQPSSIAEQRELIRATYKRSHKRGVRENVSEVIGDAALADVDRFIKQEIACYLKAQDFSYSYIGDAVGVSSSTVKRWFADEELALSARVAVIREDLVSGAIKLLKTYAIELIEGLMQIWRDTEDDELAMKLGLELLDRLGISKVNKSESKTAATLREEREVSITDRTGLLEAVGNMPPHVQSKMAEAMEQVTALAEEYGGVGVDPDA
jgi:hypothetical protein